MASCESPTDQEWNLEILYTALKGACDASDATHESLDALRRLREVSKKFVTKDERSNKEVEELFVELTAEGLTQVTTEEAKAIYMAARDRVSEELRTNGVVSPETLAMFEDPGYLSGTESSSTQAKDKAVQASLKASMAQLLRGATVLHDVVTAHWEMDTLADAAIKGCQEARKKIATRSEELVATVKSNWEALTNNESADGILRILSKTNRDELRALLTNAKAELQENCQTLERHKEELLELRARVQARSDESTKVAFAAGLMSVQAVFDIIDICVSGDVGSALPRFIEAGARLAIGLAVAIGGAHASAGSQETLRKLNEEIEEVNKLQKYLQGSIAMIEGFERQLDEYEERQRSKGTADREKEP
jgi:hypothetical protein